jgi:hypothetical protein
VFPGRQSGYLPVGEYTIGEAQTSKISRTAIAQLIICKTCQDKYATVDNR